MAHRPTRLAQGKHVEADQLPLTFRVPIPIDMLQKCVSAWSCRRRKVFVPARPLILSTLTTIILIININISIFVIVITVIAPTEAEGSLHSHGGHGRHTPAKVRGRP